MSEKAIKARKSWRVRGAEWIVLGGAVAGLAWFAPVIAPALVALYGVYHWVKSGNYNQGLFIIASAVLMTILLLGPLRGVFWPLKWVGGVMIAAGALAMMIPSVKAELSDPQVIEVTAQSVDEE